MSVTGEAETITLAGHCGVNDVEPLLNLLQSRPSHIVDLSRATHLHGAVLQLLLAFSPPLASAEGDPFIAKWVIPLLRNRQDNV